MMRATAEAAGRRAGVPLPGAARCIAGQPEEAGRRAYEGAPRSPWRPSLATRAGSPFRWWCSPRQLCAEEKEATRAALARYGPVAQGMASSRHYAAALVTDARGDATAVGRGSRPPASSSRPGSPGSRASCTTACRSSSGSPCTRATMTRHVCSRRRRSSPSRTRTSNAPAVAGGHAGALIDHDPALLREAVKRAATSQDRRLEAPAREVPGRMPAASGQRGGGRATTSTPAAATRR
jgi:hypothetical protein